MPLLPFTHTTAQIPIRTTTTTTTTTYHHYCNHHQSFLQKGKKKRTTTSITSNIHPAIQHEQSKPQNVKMNKPQMRVYILNVKKEGKKSGN